jgi:hypothetical protein
LSLLLIAWNLSSENWLHLVYDNCAELMRSLACNGKDCCHCELTQNETKCFVDDKYGRNTLVHPPVWVKFCILIINIIYPLLAGWTRTLQSGVLRVQWNPVLGDPSLYPHSMAIVLPKVEQGRCP